MKAVMSFIIGLLLGVLFFSLTAMAGSGIKSSFFNDNKISFNGKELDLGAERMITVIREGQNSAENYIPIRRTFEEIGFDVEWNAQQNTVVISKK